ncbi:MAG: hypothetical protein FJ279_10035, partial [Planctomycetes bacterium]|nr:hypothetical protein [Planctomycetota bacterium]
MDNGEYRISNIEYRMMKSFCLQPSIFDIRYSAVLRRRWSSTIGALAALSLALWLPRAHAQPLRPDEVAHAFVQANERYQAGTKLLAGKKPQEALKAFGEAAALY